MFRGAVGEPLKSYVPPYPASPPHPAISSATQVIWDNSRMTLMNGVASQPLQPSLANPDSRRRAENKI